MKARIVVLVSVLCLVGAGVWVLRGAAVTAVGYSAKQLCSGRFVADLPESLIIEQDIHVQMALLGPALSLLSFDVDEEQLRVSARLFGRHAEAVYWPQLGCVLNPVAERASAVALAPPSPSEAVPVAGEESLAELVETAFAEPEGGGRNTLAVVVMQRGYIVAESYRHPVSVQTPLQGWSMNKSLMATWVGLQVESGALALQSRVSEVLPDEVQEILDFDTSLRLDHLLHMESGLNFSERYFPGDDVTRMLYGGGPMWMVPLGLGHAHAPGEHFNYSSGDTNAASLLWQQSLGDQDYVSWLRQRFYSPLGIASAVSEPDAAGVQVGSSYTYMTARDWARVGQFWLQALQGRSTMLSQDWMQAAITPRQSNTQGNYGRGFWLNTLAVDYPELPRDMFYAGGHMGQYVVILPAQELVIVRLGLTVSGADSGLSDLVKGVLRLQPQSVSEI